MNRILDVVFWSACLVFTPNDSMHAQSSFGQEYQSVDERVDQFRGLVIAEEIEKVWLNNESNQTQWLACRIPTAVDRESDFVVFSLPGGERTRLTSESNFRDWIASSTENPVTESAEIRHEFTWNPAEPLPSLFLSVTGDDQVLRTYQYDSQSDQFAEVAARSRRLASMRSNLRRSKNSSQNVEIQINNQTSGPLRLVWIDTRGQNVSYGLVGSGELRTQRTFAGHLWELQDPEDSNSLIRFESPRLPCTLTISDEDLEELRQEAVSRTKEGTANEEQNEGSLDFGSQRFKARFQANNLQILQSGKVVYETTDGTPEHPYTRPVRWSPDFKKVACFRTQVAKSRIVTLVDSAPDDQLQPKRIELAYPKPGDPLDVVVPHVFAWQSDGRWTHDVIPTEKLGNVWSISQLSWSKDSLSLRFLFNERGHQKLQVCQWRQRDKEFLPLIVETSNTFIDYAHKTYLKWMDDSDEVIWMSERDGWNHLYLFDSRDGRLKRQLTSGNWVVREVFELDEATGSLLVAAGGFQRGEDPYHRHLCRVDFEGNVDDLTPSDGEHEWEFSPDGRFLYDRCSRVDMPPRHYLRSAKDGGLIATIALADWTPLLKAGWQPTQRFVAKGRDGNTDIFGLIVWPRDFDPSERYPVIEAIYAGPQDSYVPKGFSLLQEYRQLAELGFVVVKIDGMGTSNRSKAFHDVCWKNLADAGFPDRKLWIEAASHEFPSIDLSRVGIYGGSAGGQNALGGLLLHGDFYHAAFADCGCHDNRMDKIWWNELWMGYPIGPHYKEQSNVTLADRLEGRLMLAVGELDRNVDPSSTYQVVDALVKANKNFEFLFLPGQGHGAGGSKYGRYRMYDFFQRALQPKSNFSGN